MKREREQIDSTPSVPAHHPLTFVLSFSHSGSTLLGRMLNMHSRILCVGELMRIKEALKKDLRCSCGDRIKECEFWRQHLPTIKQKYGLNYRKFTPKFYGSLRTASQNEAIVDLSKTKVFRTMTGYFSHSNWKSESAGFIVLLRDPRGVGASLLRTNNKGLDRFLFRYKKWMKRYQELTRGRKSNVLALRYEDLCMYPERELKRVCQFIGTAFEPQMLLQANETHHFIHSSTSNYMKNINELKIDERWRSELSADQVRRINAVIEDIDLLKDAYPLD
ncbi:sulfotransferase family protein [Thiohalomonas denitrificans]|uniref:Sulfotransferase domain-containing protein n=1 Tax=Thiohalomonas denitrificans TaxID=415747 RepID=A0A1G5PQN7_9GAMM|nr:sulfotransferase [Thiohalomonas denitrificans]SCZ51965.1 Sulfotransferase domain-containing protein [Thiohalomonas denitrificans]